MVDRAVKNFDETEAISVAIGASSIIIIYQVSNFIVRAIEAHQNIKVFIPGEYIQMVYYVGDIFYIVSLWAVCATDLFMGFSVTEKWGDWIMGGYHYGRGVTGTFATFIITYEFFTTFTALPRLTY